MSESIKEIDKEVRDVEAEFQAMQDSLRLMTLERDKAFDDLRITDEALKDAGEKLQKQSVENEELHKRIAELQDDSSIQAKHFADLREKSDLQTKVGDEFQQRVDQLSEALQEKLKQFEVSEKENNEMHNALEQLTKERDDLQKQIENMQRWDNEITLSVKETNEKLAKQEDLQNQIAALIQERDELQADNERLNAVTTDFQTIITKNEEAHNEQINQLVNEVTALRNDKQSLETITDPDRMLSLVNAARSGLQALSDHGMLSSEQSNVLSAKQSLEDALKGL